MSEPTTVVGVPVPVLKPDDEMKLEAALTLGLLKPARRYSSLPAATEADKVRRTNLLNGVHSKLDEVIGQEIVLTDLIVHDYEYADEEDGEVKTTARVLLICASGKVYQSWSVHIRNNLKGFIGDYGWPTWKPGLRCRVLQKPGKDPQRRTYRLELLSSGATDEPSNGSAARKPGKSG